VKSSRFLLMAGWTPSRPYRAASRPDASRASSSWAYCYAGNVYCITGGDASDGARAPSAQQDALHPTPEAEQTLGQGIAVFEKALGRHRDRHRDGTAEMIDDRGPDRADSGAMLLEIVGKMHTANIIEFVHQALAAGKRKIGMIGEALLDQLRALVGR